MVAWGGFTENYIENLGIIFENGLENSKMISKITWKIQNGPQKFKINLKNSKITWKRSFHNDRKNITTRNILKFKLPNDQSNFYL